MAAEIKQDIALEIAHVLFIDIVAYSQLASDDQRVAVQELNQIVIGFWGFIASLIWSLIAVAISFVRRHRSQG